MIISLAPPSVNLFLSVVRIFIHIQQITRRVFVHNDKLQRVLHKISDSITCICVLKRKYPDQSSDSDRGTV